MSISLRNIGLWVALLPVALISLLMLGLRVNIPQTYDELPIIERTSLFTLLVSVLGALGLFAVIYLLRRVSPRALFAWVTLVFLTLSFGFIGTYSGYPRADAGLTFDSMIAYLDGNLDPFLPGGYIHQYPHQIGLMYYYMLGYSLFGGTRWLFYANVIWGLISNYSIWSIVRTSRYQSQTAEVAAIILPVVFLPHMLFTLYGYNHTPSLALALYAIYRLQLYVKSQEWSHLASCTLAFSGAILVRQNFKITLLAAIIVAILVFLHSRRGKMLLAIVTLVVAAVVPGVIAQKTAEAQLGVDIGKGIPTVAWVALGLQDSRKDPVALDINRERLPGWYNSYSGLLWSDSGFNTDETARRAKEDLGGFISARLNEPFFGAQFFLTKIASSWLEPTYQSLFVAYLPDSTRFFKPDILHNLYSGESVHSKFVNLLRPISLLLMTMSTYMLWNGVRARAQARIDSVDVIAFAVLGGFLFHLIWETKSLYVYSYTYMSIVLAAIGIGFLSERISECMMATSSQTSDETDATCQAVTTNNVD